MKGFKGEAWDIGKTVLASFIVIWLSNLSFDGLFSTALESTQAFKEWLSGTLEIPRWKMLAMLALVTVSSGGFVVAYILNNKKSGKALKNVDDLTVGLTDAFNKAAKQIQANQPDAPTYPKRSGSGDIKLAINLMQLDPVQIELLKFFASNYSSGKEWSSSREAANMTNIPVLRAEQKIDDLVSLGVLRRHQYSDGSGRFLQLSPFGREWLLANRYE